MSSRISAIGIALVLSVVVSPVASGARDDVCDRYSPGEEPPFSNCVEVPDLPTLSIGSELPANKRTSLGLYMSARDAHQAVETHGARALFLDIRTRPEVAFLGMPLRADASVPFMHVASALNWDERPVMADRSRPNNTGPATSFTAAPHNQKSTTDKYRPAAGS